MSFCPDTSRPRFDVARIGGAWRVVDPAGQIVGGAHDNRARALTQRDILQAEADRRAKRMTRPCLCCGNPFESEGIHNRLCNVCRGKSSANETGFGPSPRTAGAGQR